MTAFNFFYPTGIASGYSGAANFLATRIGTVTGYSGVTAPSAPAGDDGMLQAMIDAIMNACGGQVSTTLTPAATDNGSSTSYADISGASMTFTPQVSRVYEVSCNFQWFRSAGTGNGSFRIVVGSTNGTDWVIVPATSGTNVGPISIREFVFLPAGSSVTIKLQWKSSGTSTLNLDGAEPVQFAVRA